MITKKVIDELYKKYRKAPSGIEDLDVGLLFDYASEHHNVQIDEDGHLDIESIDARSPFRRIPLNRICGITHFENSVAIVLPSSIIFLNKHDNGVNVHLRAQSPSIWEKIKWMCCKN